MKVQIPAASKITDSEMQFIREMGIRYLSMTFFPDDTSYDSVCRLQERCEKYDLTITDGGCSQLFKNASIHLGLPGRDEAIDRYNDFTRVLGRAGIGIGYAAWQPGGILRTAHGPGQFTRGGISMSADMDEILSRPYSNERDFSEEEIWDNFKYFLDRALPVCEESNVKLALHPNDPPAPKMCGVPSLIYNTDCYRKAFELAGNSPYLGMKLCVGCWLEGGDQFGDLMGDIKEFCEKDRIYSVHFRNVSSPMPKFEEVLCEDGYAEMYSILKQLLQCGYDGVISVDHAFQAASEMGGRLGGMAYPTGYLKGMLYAAEKEILR